jgi:glycerol-3-phosphate dehydrogenase (NAD(P)+)
MNGQLNNIAVIGGGAWGTALAQVFAEAGRNVSLYARDAGLAAAINKDHENTVYLPGIPLNKNIHATSYLAETAKSADIILLVTPAQFVRNILVKLKPHLAAHVPLINCAKGIEVATGELLSAIAAETVPDAPYAVLSGPTFAHEVARGLPTAVTLATKAPLEQAQRWAQALSSRTFRPYTSTDPAGAEIAGALKNVVAIACGIVDGRGLGQNAKAAVMTRGMAEIKRLGMKKGADAETFLGLSGLGDLTLTCNSMSSRNYSLGVALGQGKKLQDILANRTAVTEGITTAKAIAAHAHKLGVDMPIAAAVDGILHHKSDIGSVINDLLARDLKLEKE